MAKLALVYGMRLFPCEDLEEIREATITLKNGRTTRVTLHLLEGELEDIKKQFDESGDPAPAGRGTRRHQEAVRRKRRCVFRVLSGNLGSGFRPSGLPLFFSSRKCTEPLSRGEPCAGSAPAPSHPSPAWICPLPAGR